MTCNECEPAYETQEIDFDGRLDAIERANINRYRGKDKEHLQDIIIPTKKDIEVWEMIEDFGIAIRKILIDSSYDNRIKRLCDFIISAKTNAYYAKDYKNIMKLYELALEASNSTPAHRWTSARMKDILLPYINYNPLPFLSFFQDVLLPSDSLSEMYALMYLLSHNIGLLPTREDKKKIEKIKDETTGKWRLDRYITTVEELQSVRLGKGNARGAGKGTKILCYSFCPKTANLIVFDIDCKHEGIDGLTNWYNFLKQCYGGIIPSFLQDVTKYPCYVKTPHGGYHVYFFYDGDEFFGNSSIVTDVEVKHQDITAAGSVRGGGKYIMYGRLEYARRLPSEIARRLKTVKGTTKLQEDTKKLIVPQKRTYVHKNNFCKDWHYKTLDELCYEAGATTAQHNWNQYHYGNKVGWYYALLQNRGKDTTGYSFNDVLQYVQMHEEIFGHGSDTKEVIKNSYEHGIKSYIPQ